MPEVAAGAADLTAVARIRNAALDGFARDGVAATSIRSVAEAAGVSPGLVQHHFPSKAALRIAVNEYVIRIAREAFADVPVEGDAAAIFEDFGDRITALVREHPTALRYVARAAAEGDPAALDLFDGFVAITEAQQGRLADAGLLEPGLDRTWAALHLVVFNLGTVMLEEAIDRHLPEPFRREESLERWNAASTAFFRRALTRP
jgi:TetR/AcrR family transcriptional regulator, regulator of cefoperazone and chloramphenicol sensitivity